MHARNASTTRRKCRDSQDILKEARCKRRDDDNRRFLLFVSGDNFCVVAFLCREQKWRMERERERLFHLTASKLFRLCSFVQVIEESRSLLEYAGHVKSSQFPFRLFLYRIIGSGLAENKKSMNMKMKKNLEYFCNQSCFLWTDHLVLAAVWQLYPSHGPRRKYSC